MRFHLLPVVRASLPLALLLPFLAVPSAADDWPQWRGPSGDNVSNETAWSPVGEEAALWRADAGRGYSGPVIWRGRLFVAGYHEDEATPRQGVDRVLCLDAATGKELWSHSYPTDAYDNEHAGGALSTPTVYDGVLYLPTRGGEVRAYSAEEGELLWSVDLVERHGVEPGRYGFASSPFVLGDWIVLNASQTVALARATGETAWISDTYDANYSTVATVQIGERACLAVFGGKGLVLVDASSGEHVHTYTFRKTPRNVEGATPIVIGPTVLISSAYQQGIALVDFSGEEPVEVWRNLKMRNKMAGSTLFEEHLYGFDESMLKCLDLEGNELWRKRGLGHGSLSIAGGRLLLTTSRGELVVADASPEEYRELSRRKVVEGGVFWTAPILANGRVYMRGSEGELVCLDHRSAGSGGALAAGEASADGPLPTPTELVRRHLAATGLKERSPGGVRLRGRLHNDSLGLADVAAMWETGADGLWHVRYDLPPGFGGAIERFFDGEHAWEVNPFRGNKLVDELELDELVRTHGYRGPFEPLDPASSRTVARESFRGVDCYRVDVTLAPELVRSVYFDAKTGFLAGRTSPKEATVVFGDWREVEGLRLPFHRTVFHPDTGEEWRWRFAESELEAPDASLFVVPEDLRDELERGGDDA
ncbi:MAG: PQQ-binding-like beta-propeller repeat protein [Planctomycetota bacterium]